MLEHHEDIEFLDLSITDICERAWNRIVYPPQCFCLSVFHLLQQLYFASTANRSKGYRPIL